jgi:molybdopterin/thiamine biosynthesis adenylyltransferase/proteasome lid subunit RPN8/RPN11
MRELRISAADMSTLRSSLLLGPEEKCAVLFAARARCPDGRQLFLVRETTFPTASDYTTSGTRHAELRPEFVAKVTKRARSQNLSLVFVHSHPGDHAPVFSSIDDGGEKELAAFFVRRKHEGPHAAIVLSKGGISARLLGQSEQIRVVSVGDRRIVEFDPQEDYADDAKIFDRQVRAFGAEGQRILKRLRVAIVGLGGTGSIAVEQLTHLGIRDFILIDPDHIELTNLNRVVGAIVSDVGLNKVEVAARYLKRFDPDASVLGIVGNIVHSSVAQRLVDADVIFCCTDSHGSRSVIQQVAYQYLIPCFDIGSTIVTQDGQVTGIFGRVQLLGPGQSCLWCSELLSSEEVRRDMMNDFERQADPYIQGANEPAPSVVSLNGTVVSLAVTMLLGFATSVPAEARHLIYNARTSTLRAVRAVQKDGCFICSRNGVYARGDAQPLFARND